MDRDRKWIKSLKEGDMAVLDVIYIYYKQGFLEFAKRYPIANDVALDVYHDSMIALFENSRRGKLDNLKSSIKTYLYAIGKYKIFALLKLTQQERQQSDEIMEGIN